MNAKNILISEYFSSKAIGDEYYFHSVRLLKSGYLIGSEKNRIDNFLCQKAEDWLGLDDRDPTTQWHFHTIGRGCGILLSRLDAEPESLGLLHKIIKMWHDCDKLSHRFTNCEQAWSGHTVALRLDFIVGVLFASKAKGGFIVPMIEEHMQYLQSHYDGNWNHGLDQSIALFKAAYVLNKPKTLLLAEGRIKENFCAAFDDDGVNLEQSTQYHNYNIEKFLYAQDLMKFAGVDTCNFNEKLELAKEFLLHSLDPSGNYSLIGDTVYGPPAYRHDSNDILCLTKGLNHCENLTAPLKKVYGSGYVFGRSSWSMRKNPTYYTIRFGHPRVIHGHNDHMSMTFYLDGAAAIVDGGFDGYRKDRFRDFFRSPKAHNVVFALDGRRFNWDEFTSLDYQFKSDFFDVYVFTDKPYAGVVRKRVVLFDLDLSVFYILDRIYSEETGAFAQNWNFPPDADIEFDPCGIRIIKNNYSYRFLFSPDDNVESFKERVKFSKGAGDVEGGYYGLGHNSRTGIFSLRNVQHGRDISWRAFFSRNELYATKINESTFSVVDSIAYSIEELGDSFVCKKSKIKKIGYQLGNVCLNGLILDLSGEALIVKNPTDSKKFLDIVIIPCSDISESFVAKFNSKSLHGEALKYFYFAPSKEKLRFGTAYTFKDASTGFRLLFPVMPACYVELQVDLRVFETLKAIAIDVVPS